MGGMVRARDPVSAHHPWKRYRYASRHGPRSVAARSPGRLLSDRGRDQRLMGRDDGDAAPMRVRFCIGDGWRRFTTCGWRGRRELLLVHVCLALSSAVRGQDAGRGSPLILISLDGFRWDYTERYAAESPTLRALSRDGATARSLIPVFPSNTFPNHYTIVTGLYPAKHGIINNDFFDPKLGAVFRFTQPVVARDPRWWGGEPVWVTAIKQGRKAATAFWV